MDSPWSEHLIAESMHIFVFIVVAALAVLQAPANAQDASPRLLETFSDWMLYSFENEQGQICYIASLPSKEEGNYSRRGQAAVLVAELPVNSGGENEQVSVQPGYSYLKDSTVDVKIGDNSFSLFTDGEHAWANTSKEDQEIIDSMKRGSDMVVRGTSIKETYSLDTYSLIGFTAAYNAMKEACGS